MIRTSIWAMAAIVSVVVVGAVGLLVSPDAAEAQSHSATRSFQQPWASPGSELEVVIAAANYGVIGQVVEELPHGFVYRGTSLGTYQAETEGNIVRFNLLGESSFTYKVAVPNEMGLFSFSGTIKDIDRRERAVGGHRVLRVGAAPTPAPTATATATPTPTPEPMPTATPQPTATPTPKPMPTATPEPTATVTPEPTLTPTPDPTRTPDPTPTATPEPTATATPVAVTPVDGNDGRGWIWVIVGVTFLTLVLILLLYIRGRRGDANP